MKESDVQAAMDAAEGINLYPGSGHKIVGWIPSQIARPVLGVQQKPGTDPEIPVTDEMIAAGLARDTALEEDEGVGNLEAEDYFSAVYRAMAALAPTELYREDRRSITELEATLVDRDRRHLDELTVRDKLIMELRSEERRLSHLVLRRNQTIAEREERIAELKSDLAMRVTTKPTAVQQTVGDQKVDPAPRAFPAGALVTPKGDSRKMGA